MYALKNANNVATLKAISQNLMHANLSVMYGVYWVLSETDVKKQIVSLGHVTNDDDKLSLLISLVKQLENKSRK